ncbi:DUF86 domain-containing protein [Massilia sp. YIM B04103]|uniref:HepT-like ribonuclease domain-containing protein n=1 Tax=Massilia sp. YIM B04103 TaxID=2963106 RepID=UPI00210DB3FC
MSQLRADDYLAHMKQAAEDACNFTSSLSKAEFLADRRTQQAVNMCLIIIGEAAIRLAAEYPAFVAQHTALPWRGMRGMRNRITHGYFAVNLDIVWDTVQTALPELLAAMTSKQTGKD